MPKMVHFFASKMSTLGIKVVENLLAVTRKFVFFFTSLNRGFLASFTEVKRVLSSWDYIAPRGYQMKNTKVHGKVRNQKIKSC